MRYLLVFFLLIRLGFSMSLDGVSWGMTQEEIRSSYPSMTKISSFKNEEIYSVDKLINSDTVTLTFLFYRSKLIQVTATNKYSRQSRSFSKSFLERIDEKYIFTDIRTRYEKSSGKIKQIKEYAGFSKDGKSHLLLKTYTNNNNPKFFLFLVMLIF